MALPVNLAEHYIGFGVANRVAMDCTSDRAVRRLWYKHLASSDRVTIPARWARSGPTVAFILAAEMSAVIRWPQTQAVHVHYE